MNNGYFGQMVDKFYPKQLVLKTYDTKFHLLHLDVSIYNVIISTSIGDFDFVIDNCLSLDGDMSGVTFYDVYISQFISFATASSQVSDFNN